MARMWNNRNQQQHRAVERDGGDTEFICDDADRERREKE